MKISKKSKCCKKKSAFFSTIDNFYIFVFANGDKMCLKTASKADKWLRLSLLPLLCADMAEVPIFTRKKPSTYLFS